MSLMVSPVKQDKLFSVRGFADKKNKYVLPDRRAQKLSYFQQFPVALIRSDPLIREPGHFRSIVMREILVC